MYLFQCCECEKIAQNHVFFCEKFQPPCLPFFKHYIFGMFIFKYSYSVPFFKGLTSTESFFTELTQCSCTKEIALFFLFFYLFLLIFPKIRWDLFCWVSAILQHRPKEWFVNILGHFFVSYSRLPSWKQKKSLKRNNKKSCTIYFNVKMAVESIIPVDDKNKTDFKCQTFIYWVFIT